MNAQSQADGTNLTGVKVTEWDTKIKNNTQLWTTIATVMNSLGYDAEIIKKENSTGFAGKINTQNNQYKGIWGTQGGDTAATWLQQDLATNNTAFIDASGAANKWYSTAEKANGSDPADAKLESGLTTTNTKTKSVFFKHNGIIWEWNQTLVEATDGNTANNTLTITLSSHSSTVPNVFKGTKKGPDSLPLSATNTAYTFKTWEAPSGSATTATNTGVTFEFKLAV